MVRKQEKIIDMRGKEPIKLPNLENFTSKGNDIASGLHDNITLIVNRAEHEKCNLENLLRDETAKLTELESVQVEVVRKNEKIARLKAILGILDHIKAEEESGKLNLTSLGKTFEELKQNYMMEYFNYNLCIIGCSHALPLFTILFQAWDPLQNPIHGVEVLSVWKDLLDVELYAQLFISVLSPILVNFFTNTSDPAPIIRFLDSWETLMPEAARHMIPKNLSGLKSRTRVKRARFISF